VNIAEYTVHVYRYNFRGSHVVAWAGGRRQALRLFAETVKQAGDRGWRGVEALQGGYLTGTTLAEWHATDVDLQTCGRIAA